MRYIQIGRKIITQLGALMLIATTLLAQPGNAFGQEADVPNIDDIPAEEDQGDTDYGFLIQVGTPSYSGEEITTRDGRIVSYRLDDAYDAYEVAEGSNATFIDMRSGQSRLVLPEGGDKLLLNLDVVYDTVGLEGFGVGYVARVGTKEDYANGRIDVIVGRFTDLQQRSFFSQVRYVDSPTALDGDRISMIVWTTDVSAQYVVVDLANFSIVESKPVDLPSPIAPAFETCSCNRDR